MRAARTVRVLTEFAAAVGVRLQLSRALEFHNPVRLPGLTVIERIGLLPMRGAGRNVRPHQPRGKCLVVESCRAIERTDNRSPNDLASADPNRDSGRARRATRSIGHGACDLLPLAFRAQKAVLDSPIAYEKVEVMHVCGSRRLGLLRLARERDDPVRLPSFSAVGGRGSAFEWMRDTTRLPPPSRDVRSQALPGPL
jgi:hypothetical protein